MRVKNAELLFALCKSPLKETSFVHLQYVDLETVSNLEWCSKATSISFRGNRLTRPGESIKLCRELWTLDLSRNEVQTLSDLQSFPAMGYLDLSHNVLKYEALVALRDMHLMCLILEGNPDLERTCTARQCRLNVIWLLPNLWVLDNRFITNTERVDAEALVSPELRAMVAAKRQSTSTLEKRGVLRSSGVFEGLKGPRTEDRIGNLASAFLSLLSAQPPSSDTRDSFRLCRLAQVYDQEACRHNDYVMHQVSGLRAPTMPLLRLKNFLGLPHRVRLDVCVLLAAMVGGPIPQVLVDETLSILASLHGLDLAMVKAWASLPPYAVFSLAYHVRDMARRQMLRDSEHYNTVQMELLEALGLLIRGVGDFDTEMDKERHRRGASLISRHVVLLLSRAPSCPPIASRPTSVVAQRSYDSMLPLLIRAGMSSTDLFGSTQEDGAKRNSGATEGAWKFGEGRPLAGTGSLPWNKEDQPRLYHRPWSSDNLSSRPTPQKSRQRPSTQLTQRRSIPLIENQVPRGLMSPGVGQWIQMRADVYTVIIGTKGPEEGGDGEGVSILVADFEGFLMPPFYGRTQLQRKEILWDPRGWWCHIEVLADARQRQRATTASRLFRPSTAMSGSGLPYNASAPNEPLAAPSGQRQQCRSSRVAARLEVFACEEAWDPTFVLAAPGVVSRQNQASRARSAGQWTPVDTTTLSVAGVPPSTAPAEGSLSGVWVEQEKVSITHTSLSGSSLGPPAVPVSAPAAIAPVPRPHKQCSAHLSAFLVQHKSSTSCVGLQGSSSTPTTNMESGWSDLQREMGSCRRLNRYGARPAGNQLVDMKQIRELLRMRRAVSEGVFQLTAVGLENDKGQQQEHQRDEQEAEEGDDANGSGCGQRDGGSAWREPTQGRGRSRLRSRQHGATDLVEDGVVGSPGSSSFAAWFAVRGGNRVIVTPGQGEDGYEVSRALCTRGTRRSEATQAGTEETGDSGEGRRSLRRKVELALLVKMAVPKEAPLGSIMRPFEPALRPLHYPSSLLRSALRRRLSDLDCPHALDTLSVRSSSYSYPSRGGNTTDDHSTSSSRWFPRHDNDGQLALCSFSSKDLVKHYAASLTNGSSVSSFSSARLGDKQTSAVAPLESAVIPTVSHIDQQSLELTRSSVCSSSVLTQGVVGSHMQLSTSDSQDSNRRRSSAPAEIGRVGCLVPHGAATAPRSPARKAAIQPPRSASAGAGDALGFSGSVTVTSHSS